ncbi:hypothetical protein [Sphingomonas colocasiae]|uniref:TonB-dependent receptor n=1 Tax=Sphingomonas colocasiae TaxID=1848973 RepID=A0ABS7PPU3_9SPHN|nr:hypothetical protein [Sphingomonas colocasiae]MBY8823344.1 hypothetical protein [Sphingomonas colocasiae]
MRAPWGSTGLPAELEVTSDEIASYGASTIGELLRSLRPRIGEDASSAMLVNGRRAAPGSSVSGYPPEAVSRIEVLPPEAATRLGYPAGKLVVNVILKREFASITGEGSVRVATRGGTTGIGATAHRVKLDGHASTSIELGYGRISALTEAERRVSTVAGQYSGEGDVVGLVPGGEIDPALTALAGVPVTTAGVPATARATPPTLADFLPLVNRPHPAAAGDARTLTPASEDMGLKIGFSRPIGGFTGSLNVGGQFARSRSLLGFAQAQWMLPPGSAWSPFAGDTLIRRAAGAPLTGRNETFGANLGFGLAGRAGKAQLSLSAGFAWSGSESQIERGRDWSGVQAAVAAGANPYGAPAGLPDAPVLADVSKGETTSFVLQANASAPLAELPAGPVSATLSLGAAHARGTTRYGDDPDFQTGRDSADAVLAFSLPLASRGGFLAPLGDLSLNLTAGGFVGNGGPPRTRFGVEAAWSPMQAIRLNLRYSVERSAPTLEQLTAPLVITPAVRLYDPVRGEVVEVEQVTGGNPDLATISRGELAAGAQFRLATVPGLTLTMDYRREQENGMAGGLPSFSADVEAAFPDRFLRDDDGRLVRVDARPISIEESVTQNLRTAINWSTALGASGKTAVGERATSGGAGAGGLRIGPAGALETVAGRGRLELSLGHVWQLADRVRWHAGLAPLDRLAGYGGSVLPRHRIEATATLGKAGAGVSLNANWQAPAWRRSALADALGDLRYAARTQVGFRLFGELGILGVGVESGWAKGLRMSVEANNLFDSRIRVTDIAGVTPRGFLPDDLDALGRTVRVMLRKLI